MERKQAKRVMILFAKYGCKMCGGKGYVTDWVPYGSTNVPMHSGCDCAFEEVDEKLMDEIDSGKIDLDIQPNPKYVMEERAADRLMEAIGRAGGR